MTKIRRSVLFMPGSNMRALEKARALSCDVVALDLEDAVAPEAKDSARVSVCAAIRERRFERCEVAVRINALSSPWGAADLAAVRAAKPDAILLPKINDAGDIAAAIEDGKIPALGDDRNHARGFEFGRHRSQRRPNADAGRQRSSEGDAGGPMPARENLWSALSQMRDCGPRQWHWRDRRHLQCHR